MSDTDKTDQPKRKRILRVWESNLLQPLTGLPPGTTVVEYEYGIDWSGFSINHGEMRIWQDHTNRPAELVVFYMPGMVLKFEDVWVEAPVPDIKIKEYDDPSWEPPKQQAASTDFTPPSWTQETPIWAQDPPTRIPMGDPLPQVPIYSRRSAIDNALSNKFAQMTGVVPVPSYPTLASRANQLSGEVDTGQIAKSLGWSRGSHMPGKMSNFFGGTVPGMNTKNGPFGTLCPECNMYIVMGDEHKTGEQGDVCSWWLVNDYKEGQPTMTRYARSGMKLPNHVKTPPDSPKLAFDALGEIPVPQLRIIEPEPIREFKHLVILDDEPSTAGTLREMRLLSRERAMKEDQNIGARSPRERFRGPWSSTDKISDPAVRLGDGPASMSETRLDLKVSDVGNGPEPKPNQPQPTPEPGSPVTGILDIASPVGRRLDFSGARLIPVMMKADPKPDTEPDDTMPESEPGDSMSTTIEKIVADEPE